MQKRTAAVTFKGNPLTLIGPQLKPGDKAPDFKAANGATTTVALTDTPAKARMFSVVPSLDTPVCSTQTRTFDKGRPMREGGAPSVKGAAAVSTVHSVGP